MNTALFFRKCENEKEYLYLASNCYYMGEEEEFEIVTTIILNPDEYKFFINNFLVDNKYIEKITEQLYHDDTGKLHCAYVTDGSCNGYLVYPSGFNYARYISYYPNEKKYIKGDQNV